MKKILLSMALTSSILVAACTPAVEKSTPEYDKGINIIPLPKELVEKQGDWELNSATQLVASTEDGKTIAEFFASKMRRSTGYSLKVTSESKSTDNTIALRIDNTLATGDEGYTLTSTDKGVEVVGRTAQGLFYGMQTLLQLLPAEIESQQVVRNVFWKVPAVDIKDEPSFSYRGMHLDPCRHFLTVEDVKRQLDVMAIFKINKMHWHLTEDQGWRIEIKKYPRLTEVGSKRIEGDGTEYGGFYTQEQIKEIVAYAAERFITIIPEIELPGHAMGAITAYPELACNPKTQKGSDYAVRSIWGVEEDVFCAGKEEVFQFISDVIDEVVALFPGEYFHIGGDECPKNRWKSCPLCQKRIKEEGLKDEYELQSYVIRRAQKLLEKHGKKLIGWEEILEGGLAPSATVMSWIGEASGIKSANMGHDVIMTPGSGGLYLDHFQGDPKIEPVAISGYSTLEKVYSYNPVPKEINEDKRHHILGAQGNLWSEYFYTTDIMEYMAYPRIIALAEAVWTPIERKDFADFARRINNAYVRLDGVGVNYHIPLPEQPGGSINFVAFTDATSLELKTTRPIKMVYTTDGSEPKATSTEYTEPISVSENVVIKVASVLPSGKLSRVRAITFEKQEPIAGVELSNPQAGLNTQVSVGDYLKPEDFASATNWVAGRVDRVNQVIPDRMANNLDEIERKAVIAEGYVLIPADGVYYFSSNYEQVSVAGKLLIDNTNEVNKHSRKDSSIALKAGYHPIKILFIGAVYGGWPTYWDGGAVHIRPAGSDSKWEDIQVFTNAD